MKPPAMKSLNMKSLTKILLVTAVVVSPSACKKEKDPATRVEVSEKATDTETTAGDDKAGASRPDTSGPKPGDIPPPSDVAAPPSDAQKTETGISYKVLSPAATAGEKPTAADKVEVHYTGWTTDGKMFDSSVKRGKPSTFQLTGVIAGWTEGVQLMTPGEKTRFWIPEELAYKGRKGAPAGMLVFDIELLSVVKPPPVPEDVAAAPKDAKKTDLGVFYKVLKSGEGGGKPNSWDKVKVHYSGWTTDGKMFDSSVARGRAAEFPLDGVIAGWTDALQLMSKGDSYRLWIPEEHAYKGAEGKPAGMLVFDVELIDITAQTKPPPAPSDVAAPPKNAKKTEKGVFYKVLTAGKGGPKPTATDKVEVHYSGWTTDGKMFDSSVRRGKPATFPLTAVIPGWTDGLQTMSSGDKTRFWIPEALAYAGRPGKPAGMLVFDVELISITAAPPRKDPVHPPTKTQLKTPPTKSVAPIKKTVAPAKK